MNMKNIRTISVKRNFEKALAKLQFTKRSIARRAGMPSGSLGGVLSNDNPTMHQIYNLSCGLGVSIEYILNGGDEEAELKKNYVFEAMREPKIRKGWKPSKPNVSARVQMILKEKGLTKLKAAQRINVIPSWWSPILKSNNPTVLVLERIAYALDVEPIDLVRKVTPTEYTKIMMPNTPF